MPEMADRDFTELHAYRAIDSTPDAVRKKIADLEKDNQKQRGEIEGLKEKAKAVPPEGAEVLTGEDAEEWKAFKALGVKAADVGKVTEERDTLAKKEAARERRDNLVRGAHTEGWADTAAPLLHKLIPADATVETKEEDVEVAGGKKEKKPVAYVTPKDGKSMRLSAWVEAEPDLSAQMFAASGTSSTGNGRVIPEQQGAGGEFKSTVAGGIDDLLAANQKAASSGNPLMPAKAT